MLGKPRSPASRSLSRLAREGSQSGARVLEGFEFAAMREATGCFAERARAMPAAVFLDGQAARRTTRKASGRFSRSGRRSFWEGRWRSTTGCGARPPSHPPVTVLASKPSREPRLAPSLAQREKAEESARGGAEAPRISCLPGSPLAQREKGENPRGPVLRDPSLPAR